MNEAAVLDHEQLLKVVRETDTIKLNGRVTQVIGLLIESLGPSVFVGEMCYVHPRGRLKPVKAEVVGFRENKVLLMPLGDMGGVGPGCEVVATGECMQVDVDERLLGRVLDGLGLPMDGKGAVKQPEGRVAIHRAPPNPLARQRIHEPLYVGVKAIDGMLTLGKGQRIGVFSGSGVGKSTLMGMIARNTSADINVIGLIGERGREVRDFIERDLGDEGRKRSVVVVATSDQPALIRLKGAMVATAIAEYFRDRGKNVMFMMDSVTRFANAQREIGLTVGEPPATRGYTPSVFALLPRLLERAGTSENGSITGLYTVLVEGDDMDEPVADSVRGILDGHIVLSRKLATQNHFPAIDVLESVSRLMIEITQPEHLRCANEIKDLMATYAEARDLINIGAYKQGTNAHIDRAISKIEEINSFLKQGVFDKADHEDTVADIINICG